MISLYNVQIPFFDLICPNLFKLSKKWLKYFILINVPQIQPTDQQIAKGLPDHSPQHEYCDNIQCEHFDDV